MYCAGLYEESHGIVANYMYDPITNQTFNLRSKETFWWDGGEPLWVTVQRSNLKSGVYFWPGSESKVRGLYPNKYFAYNKSVKFEDRVDTVVEWLSNDIDLAMLYFHEPDSTGHQYGPNSPEVIAKVEEMDTLLGYIVSKIDNASLWDSVNVLVTSDHGMTEVSTNKLIDLLDYVDKSDITHAPSYGPVANIKVKDGKLEDTMRRLSNVSHLTVYRREDVPSYWHYSNNPRILDIVAVADEHWSIAVVTNFLLKL